MIVNNDFEVITLENDIEYGYLIILNKSNSPYNYICSIAQSLNFRVNKSKVLVDQILHVGNTDKRYMEYSLNGDMLTEGKFVKIAKNSIYRKISCEYFKGKSEIMEGSILTSIQQRMINKGIAI